MFDSIVAKYSAQFEIPASWIEAVIITESSGDPAAYRFEPKLNEASYGLMQLLLSTARGLGFTGRAEELYDPDTNIYFGTKLLADLKRRYGTDLRRIYSAYNSGRPDLYLTSSQVAANVQRFLRNFTEEPIAAAAAGGGGLLVAAGVVAAVFLGGK
jgi:soluble lytic murein transglycosylase-like protein